MPSLFQYFSISLLLTLALDYCRGDEGPMVAFVCGKPARYLADSEWQQASDATDCLSEPQDILRLCQELFPRATVTNVAESTRPVTIGNWCAVNVTHCEPSEHTVTAYRCLASSFQSEALLVPSQCIFDHVHSDTECQASAQWRPAAIAVCQRQRMVLASAAPISACGIGHFLGIEFVCCPATLAATGATTPLPSPSADSSSSGDTALTNDATTQLSPGEKVEGFRSKLESATVKTKESDIQQQSSINYVNSSPAPAADVDVYEAYVADEPNQFNNEHEYYRAAKQQLATRQHIEMSQLIKEWSEAEQSTLQSTDTNTSNSDAINSEYQNLHDAKLNEHRQQRINLLNIHQKRVQAQFDSKREELLSAYSKALRNKKSKSEKIQSALKHYLCAEQKDRQHNAQYYAHLLESEPGEALLVRANIEEHLRQVNRRMRQALTLLDTRPHIAPKIKKKIAKFMRKFTAVDEAVKQVLNEQQDEEFMQTLNDYDIFASSEESMEEKEQMGISDIAHYKVESLQFPEARLKHVKGKHHSVSATNKKTVLVVAGVVAGMLMLIGIAALVKHVRSARDTVSSSAVVQQRCTHLLDNADHDTTKHFESFANPSCHTSNIAETTFSKDTTELFYHPSTATSSLLAARYNDSLDTRHGMSFDSQHYACEHNNSQEDEIVDAEEESSVESLMASRIDEPMSESDDDEEYDTNINQAPNDEESDVSDDDTLT